MARTKAAMSPLCENEDKPGLPEKLTTKWKTASRRKKLFWMVLFLLAALFVYNFKKEWDKSRAARKK